LRITVLCLVLGIVSYPGEKTGLRAASNGEFFKEQANKIAAIRKATPIFDLIVQAPGSQPSTSGPTPAPSQSPTTLESPTPAPVQPAEVPTPKPVPPMQSQPSTPTPAPPQLPTPTPVKPSGVTTPESVPSSPPAYQRRRVPPQPSTSPRPRPTTPATQPPSAPAQAQPATPTTGPAPFLPSPAAPGVTPSPPAGPVSPQAGSGVVFNFDNADLYEVIRVMSEIMKINYIVDPKVRGTVNIHTSGQISAKDVFPIFQSILRLNGATAVKKDGVYEIVPMGDAKKLPIPPSTAQGSGKPSSEEKYVIQIVSLKYIPVAEVSKMIKPFLSDGADIVEHPPNNILVIGDLASNVKKSVDIINLFDIDIFTDLRVRIYPITNADVNEVAKEMERIFSSFEVSTKSGRGVGITFTPVVRINSLLVVSSIPNIFEKVEGWLKELDKIPMEGTKYSVFVYHVQNAKAKDLAEVLKQIYVSAKDKKGEFKEKVAEQVTYPRGVKPPPTPAAAPPSTTTEGGAVPEGEINIVVDETNNALVVRAFARDYKSILETIKKLDIYPRQVLIEILLADINLTDDMELGFDQIRYHDGGKVAHTVQFGEFGHLTGAGAGVTFTIAENAGRYLAAITAAASLGRAKVVTAPHLLASNNKEAKIQIGTSEPILTNTYTSTGVGTTTTPTGFVEGTIEYKDIGTILTITPRISDGGLVSLELSIEESTLASRSLGRQDTSGVVAGVASSSSTFTVPAFNKTTAKTVLSIKDGQTIAIGGLIRQDKEQSNQGVPFLGKIPVIGFFFGKNTRKNDRRELILLLTPHIVTDEIQSKTVTDELKEKITGLKEDFEKARKKKEKK
jgi:general secretion pathway protein D